MRSFIQPAKITKGIAFIVIIFAALSFSVKPGGEGFEIYLNNKLLLQQFGNQLHSVQNIQVDQSIANSQLVVKYYHCGRPGTNRVITIRDGQNKILKEWKYANVSTTAVTITDASMSCKVSDILSLQKTNGKLNLYYSSKELPDGRTLAYIITPTVAKAK